MRITEAQYGVMLNVHQWSYAFDFVFVSQRSVAEALVRKGLLEKVKTLCVPEDSPTGKEVLRVGYKLSAAGLIYMNDR